VKHYNYFFCNGSPEDSSADLSQSNSKSNLLAGSPSSLVCLLLIAPSPLPLDYSLLHVASHLPVEGASIPFPFCAS
jgi:hypothetical protein